MVTEVEVWSVRVSGWSAGAAQALSALAEFIAVPDRAFDGAALLVSLPKGASLEAISAALVKAGATVRSAALVGSHATRYTVAADKRADAVRSAESPSGVDNDRQPPATAPRRARDRRPTCPGKSTRAGRRQGVQAVLQRDAVGAEPEGDRGLSRGRRAPGGLSGRLGRRHCARRSARAFGLDPDRIVCGAGSDDLLNLLARAYLADGDEAIHTTHGFLVYPIATLGTGAKPVVAPEKNYTADVDAILERGDAEDQDRVPRQSEQSDRHLHSVRRGQAPAQARCRRMCCSCSTRPMPNTCGATTTSPASSWSPPPTTS